MNITWDADSYAQEFSFVPSYGAALLDLLDIGAGDTVVDLGCGTGALTAELAKTGATVTGVDASADQLAVARRDNPGLRFILADATSFTLDEPMDAVFSNAVFHWIDDERQPELLAHVRDALKPGGQLVFECGGRGCCQRIHAALARAFAAHGLAYAVPFYFPTVGEYTPRLEQAGLTVDLMAWFERPTPLAGGERGLADWIRMFDRVPFQGIDDELAAELIAEAEAALRPELFRDGAWVADYVRLRGKAHRAR